MTVLNGLKSSNWTSCTPPSFPTLAHQPPSPTQANGSLLIGRWDPNHTSTAALIYKESTLPTPWPILLAGYLFSLATALFSSVPGCIKLQRDNYDDGAPPSHFLAIISSAIAGYQSLRAVFAFGAVCQALAETGGRYMAPSGILVLTVSMIPYVFDVNVYGAFRVLAGVGLVCNLITHTMLLIAQHADYYGKWYLVGGNCPKIIGRSKDVRSCPQQYFVGCFVDKLARRGDAKSTVKSGYFAAQPRDKIYIRNPIYVGEAILGATDILIEITLVVNLYYSLEGIRNILRKANMLLSRPFMFSHNLESFEDKTALTLVTAIFTLIFGVVAFPINYVTQTRSTSFVVQDAVGNFSEAMIQLGNETFDVGEPLWQTWTGNGVNGSVWTDFFLASTPSDRYGFLELWWRSHRSRVWHWLPLM
jgi:hypothetical protein